jgi:hypothetical protein
MTILKIYIYSSIGILLLITMHNNSIYSDISYAIFHAHGSDINTSKNENTNNISTLTHDKELNRLIYTINGVGISGIETNESYVYNNANHQLTHINSHGDVIKKNLSSDQISKIISIFYNHNLFSLKIDDKKECPDCLYYGLYFDFFDPNDMIKISSFHHWTDVTSIKGVDNLRKAASYIEALIP